MYEKFTDRLRKVMQRANQEAQRFNHEYIGTEHMLLALCDEGSGVAAGVLGDKRNAIADGVSKIVQRGPEMVTMGKLPQTPRGKKVVEYAIDEARQSGCGYVGTEHLLLGLMRETEGVAYQALTNNGFSLDSVREQVRAYAPKVAPEVERMAQDIAASWKVTVTQTSPQDSSDEEKAVGVAIMASLANWIVMHYGKRCEQHQAGCPACQIWRRFDELQWFINPEATT